MTTTSTGLTGSPVTFTATGTAGATASITLNGGVAQTDTVAATLAPYSVAVSDAFGNPKSGVTVSWTVTGGGGSITSSSVTNAAGMAGARRELGTAPGIQTDEIAKLDAASGTLTGATSITFNIS